MNNVKLEIGDFLGFCDLNGIDALDSENIQKLEDYIQQCNAGMINGEPIVEDAIYDRLMEILRRVNPSSDLANKIWEDIGPELDDTDSVFRSNPMYSIMTVKDYTCDEIKEYVKRLPDGKEFDAHVSVKLNGHGIRLKYQNGKFIQARSRARSSAGRDITRQLGLILGDLTYLEAIKDIDICEIRGEWVMPFENLDKARQYNPDIKSAFSGVSSMGRESATDDECRLLSFVAYEFLADGVEFSTKEDEYNFLESDLGFEVPMYWIIPMLTKETLIDSLQQSIVPDCEADVNDENNKYGYYTDGLVFSLNDKSFFKSLGDDGGHYKFGNMALKVGYWKQDMYTGYVQTIMWMKGKTKITPVAIVAEEPELIEFTELNHNNGKYVFSRKEIANYDALGCVTASGNKVRRVPLYEPANMVMLDAFKGNIINFRYGGEAGVVPCFDDGTLLIDGRIKQIISTDTVEEVYDEYSDDEYEDMDYEEVEEDTDEYIDD